MFQGLLCARATKQSAGAAVALSTGTTRSDESMEAKGGVIHSGNEMRRIDAETGVGHRRSVGGWLCCAPGGFLRVRREASWLGVSAAGSDQGDDQQADAPGGEVEQ